MNTNYKIEFLLYLTLNLTIKLVFNQSFTKKWHQKLIHLRNQIKLIILIAILAKNRIYYVKY
jgi:hypothetical protein